MRYPLELFTTFLRLGLIAFGGPVAHLGYFHRWFVEDRQWLDNQRYGQLLALCQMLPGPTSSQTGFAIGLQRAGIAGGIAAWLGFTLPSALLMIGLGVGITHLDPPVGADWLTGLKLAAIAVVAHALYGMVRQLCTTRVAVGIAACSMGVVSLLPSAAGPFVVIIGGALAGLALIQPSSAAQPVDSGTRITHTQGRIALGLFAAGLLLVFSLPALSPLWRVLYQSGALVFGGGHVVLPLLESGIVGNGLIDAERFIAGYGAAQALPGPLFAFGGFIGAGVMTHTPVIAGLIATVLIFAPGLLLVVGLLPVWQAASHYRPVRRAVPGINAAVVGLLAAALWDPVIVSGITRPVDVGIALTAFILLWRTPTPPWVIVPGCALASAALSYLPSIA